MYCITCSTDSETFPNERHQLFADKKKYYKEENIKKLMENITDDNLILYLKAINICTKISIYISLSL